MAGSGDGLLRDLQASRERLLAVVAGVSEEQFKRRPATSPPAPLSVHTERSGAPAETGSGSAGDWSIAEVLAHLLAAEQRQCARIEALAAGDTPGVPVLSDEERNTEARLGRAVPVPQVIHGLLAARRRLERALTETDSARTEAIARAVRNDVIAHEGEHRAQVEAVKASLGSVRTTGR